MIYLAYPNSDWQDPPEGEFTVLDYDNFGWPNTLIAPHPQFPQHVNQYFEHYKLPPAPLIPLSEEGVLSCGLINSNLDLGNTFCHRQALVCVSRPIQRRALPDKFNPKWGPPGTLTGKQVVKACASTLNRGVRIIPDKSHLEKVLEIIEDSAIEELNRVKRAGGYEPVIVEEFMEGPAFEIDGVCGPYGLEVCFHGLEQFWEGEKITKYHRVSDSMQDELEAVADEITDALNLKRCGFSIELRPDPWRVVEVNGRIGEDSDPFYSLLSDQNPMQVLYDVCSRRT